MWLDIYRVWIKEGKTQAWLNAKLERLKSNGELIQEVINGVWFDEYQEISNLLAETFPQ